MFAIVRYWSRVSSEEYGKSFVADHGLVEDVAVIGKAMPG